MIIAIYNDETVLAFGDTISEVTDKLAAIDDFDKAYNINLHIAFYDAKKLNTIAHDARVIIEIIPD